MTPRSGFSATVLPPPWELYLGVIIAVVSIVQFKIVNREIEYYGAGKMERSDNAARR